MKKLKKFIKNHFPKLAALLGIAIVTLTMIPISVSAAEDDSNVVYRTIAPVTFSNFTGPVTAVAFPGPHSVSLKVNANDGVDILDNTLYREISTAIKYGNYGGLTDIPYIQIYLSCNYSSVNVNQGSYFSGSKAASDVTSWLTDTYSFEVYPVENSYVEDVTYYYTWNIILETVFFPSDYDAGYYVGYEQAKEEFYLSGYEQGFADGRAATDSANLGQNLLGDTLAAPFKGLNSFVIYESSGGFEVTLGGVVGACICLTLFIAFLKMFAGG